MSYTFENMYALGKDIDALTDCLGRHTFAPWLIAPVYREKSGTPTPRIPDQRGCATGLFYLDTNTTTHPPDTLAFQFVLPFQWKKEEKDSQNLPMGLGGEAGISSNVRRAFQHTMYQDEAKEWSLHFPEGLERPYIKKLQFRARSIEAPLIAGLFISLRGGRPKPNIFATGHWTESGMERIEGVTRKIDAIIDLYKANGFDHRPVLFVPADNFEEARTYTENQNLENELEIKSYPQGEDDLERCFEEHLQYLEAPPGKTEPLERRLNYANRPFFSGSQRQHYYLENLLEDLAQQVRQKLDKTLHLPQQIDKMLLSLSFHPEQQALLLHACKPKQAALLYTEQSKEKQSLLEQYIPKEIELVPIHFDTQAPQEALAGCIEFLKPSTPEKETFSIVEITGGTKVMTAIVLTSALRYASSILYLEHDFASRRPIFGTENPTRLDWLQAHHTLSSEA